MMGYLVNNKLENMEGRTWSLILRYFPSICLEGPRKITKTSMKMLISGPRFELRTFHIQNRIVDT
jgi:hypothetical protein